MNTNTKRIPRNAVGGSTGGSTIPDAICLDNIDAIRRGAVELNHRARLGLEIIAPVWMHEAAQNFYADIDRLYRRTSGLRMVNAESDDPIAERAARERQRQVEYEERGKQVAKQLSESLTAFEKVLEKAFAEQQGTTVPAPQEQSVLSLESSPIQRPSFPEANDRPGLAKSPEGSPPPCGGRTMNKKDPEFRAIIIRLQTALANLEKCIRKQIEAEKAAEMGLGAVSSAPSSTPKRRKKQPSV
ncbi:MAG: hypothetical protein LUE17_05350 [Planctomycetaceae bacterium]|nr:hypothetical protein [Planctomycetaceae bacterium]